MPLLIRLAHSIREARVATAPLGPFSTGRENTNIIPVHQPSDKNQRVAFSVVALIESTFASEPIEHLSHNQIDHYLANH